MVRGMDRRLLLLGTLTTLACATPPGPPPEADPRQGRVIHDASIREVWRAARVALRDRAWLEDERHRERTHAILTTEWFEVSGRGGDYMDCGAETSVAPSEGRVRIRLEQHDDSVEVRIRARWRGRTRSGDPRDCSSRGVAEAELLGEIRAALHDRGSP